jgi:hypothetical protein
MLCDTDADAKGSAFHVGRRRSPGAPAEAFNPVMPPTPLVRLPTELAVDSRRSSSGIDGPPRCEVAEGAAR